MLDRYWVLVKLESLAEEEVPEDSIESQIRELWVTMKQERLSHKKDKKANASTRGQGRNRPVSSRTRGGTDNGLS